MFICGVIVEGFGLGVVCFCLVVLFLVLFFKGFCWIVVLFLEGMDGGGGSWGLEGFWEEWEGEV